ncbi:hypothetical protein BDY24DRAFT_387408 [Mrakia frigida]|uniref:uncharacterized protein n=1 Tax=Mrakia frigida TaxID=29902 RepID=UPI003FCC1301
MPKPSVLILGGISTFASPLLSLLVPEGGEALVSFVRIVDKVSVVPATTYVSPDFLLSLKHTDLVEYRQANLTVSSTVTSVFDPPPGKEAFTIVYDLTGERDSSRPEIMHMTQTAQLAAGLGAEAQRRKVDAYVRVSYPYYKMSGSEKGGHKESSSKLVPDEGRGQWRHEASRALANIPDLNLVILRIGAEYGPNSLTGVVLPRIVAGHIYKYLKQDMKLLWSSDLKIHTIHTTDVALAAHLASEWIRTVGGRVKADALAAVEFSPSGVSKEQVEELKGICPVEKTPKAVLFNIVDDGSTTQDVIAKAVSKFWGIKHDYYGAVTALFAKLAFKDLDFREMVEDANEMHIEAWGEMLQKNTPPIDNSPISPYLPEHEFQKNAINLDGSKARKLLNFVPKHPALTLEEVEKIVKGFQAQNLWPN